MYHTLKDWWNAFMVLPEGKKVDRVIFLDSHAHGYLDPIWDDLFGSTMHIKQIEEGTCLEQAILSPLVTPQFCGHWVASTSAIVVEP
jgi:hypothetical protein